MEKTIVQKVFEAPLKTNDVILEDPVKVLENGGRDLDKSNTPLKGLNTQKIFNQAVFDIEDSFSINKDSEKIIKSFNFTKSELKIIFNVEKQKPFHFKNRKNLTFIVTGDNNLMLAEEYLKRLEGGVIKYHRLSFDYMAELTVLKRVINNLNSEEHENIVFKKYCTKLGFFGMIKVLIKSIFKS